MPANAEPAVATEPAERIPLSRRRWPVHTVQVLLVVALIALWWIGTAVGFVNPFFWSTPADVLARLGKWFGDGTILGNLLITLYEAGAAFLIGSVSGVVLGFLLGMTDFWARVLHPIVSILNAVPRLVFAPIFFLIFGLGPSSKIAIAVTLIFFVVFFNAFQGVREVDPTVLANARMLGARSRYQVARRVLFPSALTWILSSLQVSVGFALIGVIVGEYLGSSQGLGYVIARSQGNLDTTGVMTGLLVLTIVAILVTIGIGRLERYLVRWKADRR